MKQKSLKVTLGRKYSIATKQIQAHWACLGLLFIPGEPHEEKCLYFALAAPCFFRSAWEGHWLSEACPLFKFILSISKSQTGWPQLQQGKTSLVFTPLSLWQTHTRKQDNSKVIFLGSRLTQDTLSALSNWMINVSSVYWDCWWTQQYIFQGTCTVPCSQLFWDRCSVWRLLRVSFTSRSWIQIWWQCPRSNLASPVQHFGKMRFKFLSDMKIMLIRK